MEELEELLYGVYTDKDLVLAATKMFGLYHARYTGVGFFSAIKKTWTRLGMKRGYGGYIRCGVKGCPWHLKMCKAQRDYNFSQVLSKMKSLAVGNVKAFDAILEIYSRAHAEAERVVRSMRPPPRERPTQPTQNTTPPPVLIDDDDDDKPEAIDDDTSDEAKVAEEMVQEEMVPMSNPENFASGSGNRKRARYKTRGSK